MSFDSKNLRHADTEEVCDAPAAEHRGEAGSPAPSTCTAGEIALASSKLFQTYRLRLYRHICVSGQSVEYLVSTQWNNVLGMNLSDGEKPKFQAGSANTIPVLQFPRKYMRTGEVSGLLSCLSGLLLKPGLPACEHKPIPIELHARMAKLRIIQQQKDHIWVPTQYGFSLGVIDGYLPSANGGRPCHTFFILSGYEARLDAAMAWGQTPPVPSRPQLSWDQTIQRACQGLPRSDGYAASMVRAFGTMPLADYMAECPEEAEELRDSFGELTTYQEAADRIYRFCMESDGTKSANDRCMSLIFALSRPLFKALRTVRRPMY